MGKEAKGEEGEGQTEQSTEQSAEKPEDPGQSKEGEEAPSDEKPPPQNSQVVVVFYGDKGKTEELPLEDEEKEDVYGMGQTDLFEVGSGCIMKSS